MTIQTVTETRKKIITTHGWSPDAIELVEYIYVLDTSDDDPTSVIQYTIKQGKYELIMKDVHNIYAAEAIFAAFIYMAEESNATCFTTRAWEREP